MVSPLLWVVDSDCYGIERAFRRIEERESKVPGAEVSIGGRLVYTLDRVHPTVYITVQLESDYDDLDVQLGSRSYANEQTAKAEIEVFNSRITETHAHRLLQDTAPFAFMDSTKLVDFPCAEPE